MGTLYTRSIEALSAKGEYIFPLDDDMLLDKDIYSTITKIGDKDNFDIIGFKGIMAHVNSNNLPNHIQETYIYLVSEMTYFPINLNDSFLLRNYPYLIK